MTDEQILERIAPVLRRHSRLRGSDAPLRPESSLIEDLDINSARMIDVVLETEDSFQIEIPDEELEKMGRVQDVIVMVRRRMGNL